MRILIFGASGRTGKEVVRQAIEHGHTVTAFVRDKNKIEQPSMMRAIEGDVSDFPLVSAAIPSHDAVISTLGVGAPLKHDERVVQGVRNICRAMETAQVRRLIYLSFIGVHESRSAVGFLLRYVAPIPLREEIADHETKETIVRNSNLDWTIVRPPTLTNGPLTQKYRSGEHITSRKPVSFVSRADVADFILREIETPKHIRGCPRLLH